jgi:L-alanine-DL-glutamate epimerase-like enolase superfamily enzyme
VPYARYGETPEGVAGQIQAIESALATGLDRTGLQTLLPAGAARNAVDCAFWDLAAKQAGRPAAALAGLPEMHPVETAFTLSLGSADEMGRAAEAASARPLLKVKLGGDGDAERIAAVRDAAPAARLIVDANESWRAETYGANMAACQAAGVELIEQPFPAADDAALASLARPIPVCADESLHVAEDLDRLASLYDAVNIKLDKTGGLTAALALVARARASRFTVMVGCMVCTSLAIAPAMLVAQSADYVDLDGPLLLTRDREPGLIFDGSRISPPAPALWG